MKKVLFAMLVLAAARAFGQADAPAPSLVLSGYAEPYFLFDAAQPPRHERAPFLYNHTRHNEFNLNLGFVKAAYSAPRARGNLALMAGTYAQYNLAAEQGLLKNVFEANAGLKLSGKHNLWLDMGIMPSHIGFESAIGKDCWNLTRSLLAENSPYFEAGAKLGYTSPNEKLYLAAMLLNGWQRIQRADGNQTPAFGTQLTLKPNGKTTLNWSTFAGNEFPDSEARWRFFQNFYAMFQPNAKWGLIAGLDIGTQQRAKGSKGTDVWFSPVAIVRYSPAERWRVAARAEFYGDRHGIIIATATPHGFQTLGGSANLDFLPAENAVFRVEIRLLQSHDEIFTDKNGMASRQNLSFATCVGLSF